MNLKVVSVQGQTIHLQNMNRDTTTIVELKQIIQKMIGTPIGQQILSFHGQQLLECGCPETNGIHTMPYYTIRLNRYYSIQLWNGKFFLDAYFASEEGVLHALKLLKQDKQLLTLYGHYQNARKALLKKHTLRTYDLHDGDTLYLGYSLNYVQITM